MPTKRLTVVTLIFILVCNYTFSQDWPGLNRYKAENGKLSAPAQGEKRVVFMGNSITDEWIKISPDFFKGKSYIDRGIGGQTTPQMLVRFRADVIKLQPKVVVILAGTNDIAGNTGPSTLEMIEDNLTSMTELAKANHIKIILCSVLPANKYPWKPEVKPADSIIALNGWIKAYAAAKKFLYVDYYSSMVDEKKGLKTELSKDGVHPTIEGYKIMEGLVEEGIKKVLKQKK